MIDSPPKLDSTTEDLMVECCKSTRTFAQVFMPDRFFRPFCSIHDQIFNLVDAPIKKKLVIAPRGIGKTTIFDILVPTKKIMFREAHYIVMIGASSEMAEQQTENLKDEITSNEMLLKFFGEQKSGSFAKDQWITESGIKVWPRGAGQKVRGPLHKKQRPNLIIIDDLENDENVESEDQRRKLRNWFHAAVINSVDKGLPYEIMVIGTLLHEDSLLANLSKDKDWESLTLSICGPDLKSNYPELMSDSEIRAEMSAHRERGTLDLFAREYMSIITAEENKGFTQKMFKRYDEREIKEKKLKLENVLLVDPAKTVSATSDFSAALIVGIDTRNGFLYVRDGFAKRLHPDELMKEAFDLAQLWNVTAIGLEVTSLNEFITFPWRNYMLHNKMFFELVELKSGRGKEKNARIGALIPFYRRGLVFHRDCEISDVLEAQLMSFPRAKYDDVSDDLANIIELLEAGDRYFIPETAEDEYKELELLDEEEALAPMNNWRSV